MKTFIKIIILTSFLSHSFGQSFEPYKHNIGVRFNGYILTTTKFHPIGKSATYEWRVEPYYTYRAYKILSLGIMGEYHKAGSTIKELTIPKPNFGVGFMVRVYYPFKFKKEFAKKRLVFYGEVSWSITNYYNLTKNEFYTSDKNQLKYSLWRIRPISISLDMYKGFSIDLSTCFFKFMPGRWRYLTNIGLSYYF